MPDIDWSVHDSLDQSENKNTGKGLNFTGALIFCGMLLVKTCCQNNTTESQKRVKSVIKNRGIATSDIQYKSMGISIGASFGIQFPCIM